MNIEILGLSELTKKEALEINGGQVTMESSFGQDVGTVLGTAVGSVARSVAMMVAYQVSMLKFW